MKKFKNYAKEFISEESGMELLQMAIIVVVSVALIGIVMWIKNLIHEGLKGSGQQVIDGFDKAGVQISPGDIPE